jgi:hypothetical protein
MDGVEILGPVAPEHEAILTPEALAFLADLHRRFDGRRRELLAAREERQAAIDAGEELLRFLEETAAVRDGDWQVAPAPADLADRRVEITGPCDRKMVINALNSGARIFMADLEDASSPTWHNVLDGQRNLRDAVRRTISFQNPDGREYRLNDRTATLVVRPRGWHLPERHLRIDGAEASGSLVDFGLYFFHNAPELVERGSGPYFYLPKLQSHLEARLWNDVFVSAQETLGIPTILSHPQKPQPPPQQQRGDKISRSWGCRGFPGGDEDVVPEACFEMTLQLRQVEVGAAAALHEFRGVVEEIEAEVNQAAAGFGAVDPQVALGQVPATGAGRRASRSGRSGGTRDRQGFGTRSIGGRRRAGCAGRRGRCARSGRRHPRDRP